MTRALLIMSEPNDLSRWRPAFLFLSLEELRPHVQVEGARGEAKFWLEPAIEEAENHGLNKRELSLARRLIRERFDEIRAAWSEHFGR